MAATVTIVNGTGFNWGITSDELGINVDTFKFDIKPQFIESLPDKQNCTRSDAYGPLETELDITGETSGSTGIMACVLGTAFVPVNGAALWGSTGGFYFQGGTITLGRGSWKKVDAKFKAKPGIT